MADCGLDPRFSTLTFSGVFSKEFHYIKCCCLNLSPFCLVYLVQVQLSHKQLLLLCDSSVQDELPAPTPQGSLTLGLFQSLKIVFLLISETVFVTLGLHSKIERSDKLQPSP